MADVGYTPDDMVGAIHRQTVQLAAYLNQPLSEINPAVALDHVVKMHAWLTKLNDLYLQQSGPGRGQDDGRASATKQ